MFDYVRGSRIRILMYHSISAAPGDRLAVHPDLFAAEVKYLVSQRFEIVSLQEACRLLSTHSVLRRKIVLTFDDGYLDFLTTAAPILKEQNLTATLFVATGACDEGGRGCGWRPSHPLLSEGQIRQVKAMGFALGSHTVTHPDLTTLDAPRLRRELCESSAAIQAWGETFLAFAYPGGRFARRERDAVEQAGYDCATIVGGRWGNGAETDRFLLKREPMLASDTFERFKQRVGGYYEWHYLWARARGIQTR